MEEICCLFTESGIVILTCTE